MSRSDRQRIYEAKRAGLTNRLLAQRRVPEDKVDSLLDAWAAEAAAPAAQEVWERRLAFVRGH